MMALTNVSAPPAASRVAATTPRMSSSTAFQSPDLAAPRLITMSTSRAPWETARLASDAFVSGRLAPRGKPITEQTAIVGSRELLGAKRHPARVYADAREAEFPRLGAKLAHLRRRRRGLEESMVDSLGQRGLSPFLLHRFPLSYFEHPREVFPARRHELLELDEHAHVGKLGDGEYQALGLVGIAPDEFDVRNVAEADHV